MSRNRLIAVLTNNDDDIYCFRKELIEGLIQEGFKVLISCPYGEKFELMKDIDYIYDDPEIDRRGTNIVKDIKLLLHYFSLFRRHRPSVVLTYTAKPNIYGSFAARALGIPVIIQAYLSAALACSVRAVKAAGSAIAISESIFLLRVMPALLRPFMNVE
jgi:galacturonosyltransferase